MIVEIQSMQKINWILITIATSISYSPLFEKDVGDDAREWTFLSTWDDDGNFLENQIIRGLTYGNIYQMMIAVRINVWEPLGWLMKALVYSICGLDSLSNRIAAFMLHTLNSVLLYELIFWILRTRFWKPHSAAAQQSALAGSIFFAIHPLNVEVIGWPSANPYTLSCTFSLISLLLYTCHVDVNRDREVKLYNYIYVSTIFYFFAYKI